MKSRICSASRSRATKSPFRMPLACRPWASRFDSRSQLPNVIDDSSARFRYATSSGWADAISRSWSGRTSTMVPLFQEALGGAAQEVGHGPFVEGERTGGLQGPFHGKERMVRGEQDPTLAAAGPHELDQRRMHVGGQIGRVRQVQIGPLEHVLDEQFLEGVAHVGADDDQIGEVDEDVLEQDRVLTAGPDPRSGDADIDRDGKAQLLTSGVDRVVEGVVEGVLVDEGRHPDQVHGSLSGPPADGHALLPGPARMVDRCGQIKPVASLDGKRQRVVFHLRQRGAQDPPVHADPVHLRHKVERGHPSFTSTPKNPSTDPKPDLPKNAAAASLESAFTQKSMTMFPPLVGHQQTSSDGVARGHEKPGMNITQRRPRVTSPPCPLRSRLNTRTWPPRCGHWWRG